MCATPIDGTLPCDLRITQAPHTGNENSIAVDPSDPSHLVVVAKDYGLTGTQPACDLLNVWTGVSVSRDAGFSWSSNFIPGYAGSVTNPLSAYNCTTDPSVVIAPSGAVYVVGLAYNEENLTQNSLVWIARSDDGGLTWDRVVAVDERAFNDKPWIGVDPKDGSLYVAWTVFGNGSRVWLRSIPGGDLGAMAVAHPILSDETPPTFDQGAVISVLGNGTVVASWLDFGGVVVASSYDHGAKFGAATFLGNANRPDFSDVPFRVFPLPQIGGDPRDGHVYVTWSSSNGSASTIYLASSSNGGINWTDAAPISSPNENDYFPSVAVDALNGDVHASWYRFIGNRNGGLLDTFYSTSRDSGQNWSRPQRLTTVSSDPTLSQHQEGGTFIGDYMGLAAAGGIVRPSFLDTRNGTADLMTAVPFAPPDVKLLLPADALPLQTIHGAAHVHVYTPLSAGQVIVHLPAGWRALQAAGGEIDANGTALRWNLTPTSRDVELSFDARAISLGPANVTANLDTTIRTPYSDVPTTDTTLAQVRVGCPRVLLSAAPVGPQLIDTGHVCP